MDVLLYKYYYQSKRPVIETTNNNTKPINISDFVFYLQYFSVFQSFSLWPPRLPLVQTGRVPYALQWHVQDSISVSSPHALDHEPRVKSEHFYHSVLHFVIKINFRWWRKIQKTWTIENRQIKVIGRIRNTTATQQIILTLRILEDIGVISNNFIPNNAEISDLIYHLCEKKCVYHLSFCSGEVLDMRDNDKNYITHRLLIQLRCHHRRKSHCRSWTCHCSVPPSCRSCLRSKWQPPCGLGSLSQPRQLYIPKIYISLKISIKYNMVCC